MFWINLILFASIVAIIWGVYYALSSSRRRNWDEMLRDITEDSTSVNDRMSSQQTDLILLKDTEGGRLGKDRLDSARNLYIGASEIISKAESLSKLAEAGRLLDKASKELDKSEKLLKQAKAAKQQESESDTTQIRRD